MPVMTKILEILAHVAQVWEVVGAFLLAVFSAFLKLISWAAVAVASLIGSVEPPKPPEAATDLSDCTIAAAKAVARKNLPYVDYSTLVAEREKCMKERKYVQKNLE